MLRPSQLCIDFIMGQVFVSIRLIASMIRMTALACVTLASVAGAMSITGGSTAPAIQQSSSADTVSEGNMSSMTGHMYVTTLRPLKNGDQQKADAIVTSAKTAMAPYQDYRKALADGYEIFLPNLPQKQYHFTNHQHGLEARSHFDPLKPTSLLYAKTPDGGYKLVGVMYTDRVDASEDDLNREFR